MISSRSYRDFDSLAEISKLGEQDLLFYTILSQGRAVWHYLVDTEGWNLYPGKYSRRPGAAGKERIPAISFDSAGFVSRGRDFYHHLKEFRILDRSQLRKKLLTDCEEIAKLLAGLKKSLQS